MTISQTGFKRDIVGSYITKDPAATLQYAVDWSEWLPTGDTIQTTAWVQESVHTNGNLVLSGSATLNGVNTIDISGGTDGELYTVKNTITTNENLTDVRRFRIKVEKRYL